MASIGWLRGTIDASTYVSSHPPEGTDFATDAVANPMLLRPLSAYTVKAIWEIKTSMAGLILGLLIIFAIKYTRSPWRNLPPRPRRLPILVYALQLRDKTWLLSKDCKERFGKFYRLNTQSGHFKMFRGLLNRVRDDLVGTYLIYPVPNQQTKVNGGGRPSFCASLIQRVDRDSLIELEMSFLASLL
jgi:hypothetical protein